MRVFYYIFYRMTKMYQNIWNDGIRSTVGGAMFVACMLYFNVMTIIDSFVFQKSKLISVGGFIVITFITRKYFFTDAKYAKLDQRWQNEPRRWKILNSCLILLYFIASLFLFIWVNLPSNLN